MLNLERALRSDPEGFTLSCLAQIMEASHCCMEHLNLRDNGLTARAVTKLCNSLKQNATLKILDLGLNPDLARGAPGGARPLQGYLRTTTSAYPSGEL